MNEENKEVKKEELTDEQVEKATGGSYSYNCSSCKRSFTINYQVYKCPNCGAALTQPPARRIIRR